MNLAKSIEACAAHGAQLVVLQELHNSLYFCQTENTQLFDLAEPIPGPSTGFYSELAAANDIVLVTSLFEKRAPGLYHNTAVVFERDGSIAGKYRKMHIPDDPAYYEKFYFTPGDIGFEPIQTSFVPSPPLQRYFPAVRFLLGPGTRLAVRPQNYFPKTRYHWSAWKDPAHVPHGSLKQPASRWPQHVHAGR